MKNITDLASLKEAAIPITSAPIKVYNPVFPGEGKMHLLVDKFEDKTYNIWNNIIAFKDGTTLYVIPCTPTVVSIVDESGFKPGVLYVPFADGGAPVDQIIHWTEMLKEAEQENLNTPPATI